MLRKRDEDPDLTLSPFDPFTYEDILQGAAARLTDSGRYVSRAEVADGAPVALPGPDLTIYGLWALYARPRSEHVRREDLRAIARSLRRRSRASPRSSASSARFAALRPSSAAAFARPRPGR